MIGKKRPASCIFPILHFLKTVCSVDDCKKNRPFFGGFGAVFGSVFGSDQIAGKPKGLEERSRRQEDEVYDARGALKPARNMCCSG